MELACKPGFVLDSHSSGTDVAVRLKRPTREQCGPHYRSPMWSCSGWGLPCHPCCQGRGALLPHHFTLTCAFRPSAVYFLWHFPSARAVQALPGTLPCGARTFLCPEGQRLSGQLQYLFYRSGGRFARFQIRLLESPSMGFPAREAHVRASLRKSNTDMFDFRCGTSLWRQAERGKTHFPQSATAFFAWPAPGRINGSGPRR